MADLRYVKDVLRSALRILRNGGWAPCVSALDRRGHPCSWANYYARWYSVAGAIALAMHDAGRHNLTCFQAIRDAAGMDDWRLLDAGRFDAWETRQSWDVIERLFLRALWNVQNCDSARRARAA